MLKFRYCLAIVTVLSFLSWEISNLASLMLFILFATPQIFRKYFTSLFGIYSKDIRVNLGPVAATLLLLAFRQDEIKVIVGVSILMGIALYNIPRDKTRYWRQKEVHGYCMKILYWLSLVKFVSDLFRREMENNVGSQCKMFDILID